MKKILICLLMLSPILRGQAISNSFDRKDPTSSSWGDIAQAPFKIKGVNDSTYASINPLGMNRASFPIIMRVGLRANYSGDSRAIIYASDWVNTRKNLNIESQAIYGINLYEGDGIPNGYDSNVSQMGVHGIAQARYGKTDSLGTMVGVQGFGSMIGEGEVDNIYGGSFNAQGERTSNGSIGTLGGVRAHAYVQGQDTVQQAVSIIGVAPTMTGAGKITNAFGAIFEQPKNATTQNWALLLADNDNDGIDTHVKLGFRDAGHGYHYILWDSSATNFQFSNNTHVVGTLTSTSDIISNSSVQSQGNLYANSDGDMALEDANLIFGGKNPKSINYRYASQAFQTSAPLRIGADLADSAAVTSHSLALLAKNLKQSINDSMGNLVDRHFATGSIPVNKIGWEYEWLYLDLVHRWLRPISDSTFLMFPGQNAGSSWLATDSAGAMTASMRDTFFVSGYVPYGCVIDSLEFCYRNSGKSGFADLGFFGPAFSSFINLTDSSYWRSTASRTSVTWAIAAYTITNDITATAGNRYAVRFVTEFKAAHDAVQLGWVRMRVRRQVL